MIKDFALYGERCSGTNYITYTFKSLTGFSAYPLFGKQFGWKHFFYQQKYTDSLKTKEADEVLFLCVARNPYQWLASLFKKQHHLPECRRTSFKSFLLDEYWTTHRVQLNDKVETEDFDDRNLNGERFKNIFEARKHKCKYLLEEMPLLVKNYEFITHENFCKDPFNLVKNVCKKYDIPFISDGAFGEPRLPSDYILDDEIQDIITANLDWELEKKMGYHPRKSAQGG